MSTTTIVLAKDIPPAARAWLGQVFQREVDGEGYCELTLRSANPIRVPTSEQKRLAAVRLDELFLIIDNRNRSVPEAEIEATIDEALATVRGGFATKR